MYASQSTLNIPNGASSGGDGPRLGVRATASTSNIGNWQSEQPAFGQSQYEPGYLLSAATSSGGPSYPAPQLIPDPVSGKRPTSMHAKFGTEPFSSTFRASSIPPRGQSIIPDDESAPPSNSLLEGLNTPETKRNFRHSVAGGFFSNSPSSSPAQQNTYATATPPSASTSTGQTSVIVFGFPAYLYNDVVQHFASIGETVSVEPPPAVDSGRNWISITYRNPWEAARAVRRNGDILAIGREECMVGVKWAESPSGNEFEGFPGSPLAETPSRSSAVSPGASKGRPITLAPSRSAFKQQHGSASGAAAAAAAGGNEWGVALRNEAVSGGAPPASTAQGANGGIWNKVSDLVFGW